MIIPGKVTCKEGQTTTTTNVFIPVNQDISKQDSIKITTGQIKNVGDYTVTVQEKQECHVDQPTNETQQTRTQTETVTTHTTETVKPIVTEVVKTEVVKPIVTEVVKTEEVNQKATTDSRISETKPATVITETKRVVESVPITTVTTIKEQALEKKEQAIHDARKIIEDAITKKNAQEIVKITKDEIKDKVQEMIQKEKQIIEERRRAVEGLEKEIKRCTSEDCKDRVMIKSETIKDEIVKDEIEIDKSRVILDSIDRMKCNSCCCFDHKKVLESVISKIKEMIPAGLEYTINVQTITGKDKIQEYLSKHHKKYLKLFRKGGFKKYYNRFSSFRVAYFKSERNALKYKKAYKYCRTHSAAKFYQLRTKKVSCQNIIKKYRVYRKLSKAFKLKCARNHITIRGAGVNRNRKVQSRVVRTPAYRRTYSRSYACQSSRSRRLQSLPSNQADITLVDTFKSHLASFKAEDRALLSKCLA